MHTITINGHDADHTTGRIALHLTIDGIGATFQNAPMMPFPLLRWDDEDRTVTVVKAGSYWDRELDGPVLNGYLDSIGW